MRFGFVTVAVAAVLAPLPALAAQADDYTFAETDLARAAEEMKDPVRQEQVAVMAEALLDSLMEMPIGSLLQSAAEIAGEDPDEIDPNTTLREVAGPEAQEAPRQFARAMPRIMGAMGTLAGALGKLAPELRRMGEDIARTLPATVE